MIDLKNLKDSVSFYELKLEDGSILHIKRPTQAMLLKMVDLQNHSEKPEEAMVIVFDVITAMFNNNVDGRTFTVDDMTNMLDFQMAAYVIEDYLQNTTATLGK